MINIQNIFRRLKIDKNEYTDLHLVRYYSSFAAISAGKVIGLTKPRMSYCPLANYLNKGVFSSDKYNAEKIMNAVKASIEKKIAEFGFFTGKRQIIRKDIAVPFGASEILMSCLKKEIIDVAVVVCDGAGTVIADKPEIVQGIGARMNGLFYTTPIKEVMKKLEKKGCSFISCGGKIDQIKGIKKAVSLGYKNIAVTINGCMENDLVKIKEIEYKSGLSVTVLAVCTTDIDEKALNQILKYADIVWSCASSDVRKIIGRKSILQLSETIPVFVLTHKGLNLAACYCSEKKILSFVRCNKQYLLSNKKNNEEFKRIKIGQYEGYLRPAKLPVRSKKEPVWIKKGEDKLWSN